MRLDHLHQLPRDILDIGPQDIKRVFPNPTLISLEGRRPEPLFLSTLLHGNETTSFDVLQNLVHYLADHRLPRSIIIFVGNVDAAEQGLRLCEGQADFNRIWAGGNSEAHHIADQVIQIARTAKPFACIDIHNNTGNNPLYGCVNRLDASHLHLASLFSRIAVYYTNPPTTQSMAFSAFCPSVTIECGRPGNETGARRATDFVIDALHLSQLSAGAFDPDALQLLHTVGRILVDPQAGFSFDDCPADINFKPDLDHLNFSEVDTQTVWARTAMDINPLRVIDENNRDLTDQFFSFDNRELRLRHAAIPAMLTLDADIIRQDCLGYLMEPL